jgi:6-phosphofructokinase 1
MRNGIDGLLREDLIELNDIFSEKSKIKMLMTTPAAALGSCRRKLPALDAKDYEAVFSKIIDIFKKYDIRYFFYIGGNDSMDTVAKLSAYTKDHDYEMCIMGVPKTIDNDLVVTDHTPGFGSAAKYIAVTLQEIIRDCAVYTVPAVTIVEIMGRDAGWLTAAAGISRVVNGVAPDLIYLPERNFSKEEFFEDVREALKKHPNVVIAVSEGIHFADGTYVCEGFGVASTDAFGHKQLSGTGKALEYAVKAEIGCKVRSIELNLPQRCAAHMASKTDLDESVMIGRAAVLAAAEGVTREMMVYERADESSYRILIGHKDVSVIANQIRKVDDTFINAAGNHVTDACCHYLLPLIQGEAAGLFEGGLPVHLIL